MTDNLQPDNQQQGMRGRQFGAAALGSESPARPEQRSLIVRYRWLLYPLLAFAVTRLILIGAGYMVSTILPDAYSPWEDYPDGGFLDVWTRGDGMWYRDIVEEGYSLSAEADVETQTNVAFFPMYPLMVRAIRPLANNDAILAGVLVSNLCLLAALVFLYRLTELEFADGGAAQRAVFYMAAAPTAYFFSALYTESAFFLFSVAAMYFARRRLWLLAGIAGAGASATRLVGVLLALALLLEWLRAHGWTPSGVRRKAAWRSLLTGLRHDGLSLLALALVPLGLLAYMAYLNARFGDPLAFTGSIAAGWERTVRNPLAVFADETGFFWGEFINQGEFPSVVWLWFFNMGTLALTTVAALAAGRRLGASYAVYTLLAALVPYMGGSISFARYALVLFPTFMMLAHWGRNPVVDRVILVSSALLLGLFAAAYVNWGFIG